MSYQIRKVGLIGSGTMGGGIATLLAGLGLPVVLLDLPAQGSVPGDAFEKRNGLALDNLNRLKKSRIPALFEPDDLDRIKVGNLEDNLDLLRDVDWIIEVVVERLEVKQDLLISLETVRKPGAIISTNTSGLSINALAAGRSDDFRRHFLGTHFFNPPRHLKLLEIIPGQETDPALVSFIRRFAEQSLGKGVVICKDTPNFIANRFISIVGGFGVNYAIDHGYTVEEVDNLTGPLIGRPKSGTFRLIDVVGVDVLAHVAANLYPAIPDDAQRELLHHAGATRATEFLLKNNWLGDKTGQGFYKKVEKNGAREFWSLDLNTLDYVPPQKVRFESVGKVRQIEETGARLKALIGESDRAAQYVWHLHAFYLSYAAQMLGQISDDILAIDNANTWGFAHELGPFEIWDALGVRETVKRMEVDGYTVAPWVQTMLDRGCETFYERDADGVVTGIYDPTREAYAPQVPDKRVINLKRMRSAVIDNNNGASLLDMGDDILLLEFHTKANALDEDIFAMLHKGLDRLENGYAGMVIGNQGDFFSAGANLFLIAMMASSGQFNQLEHLLRLGQDTLQTVRYFPKPIVIAPFNVTVGGGAEVTLSGARVVAHAELYIGLVEIGVGVVPAWGGTKEMVRRIISPAMHVPNTDPLPLAQKALEQIALAKTSGSAMEARSMGFLTPADRIVMNRDHLLAEAKRTAIDLVAGGYVPMAHPKLYAAGRDVKAALHMGIYTLGEGRYATAHEVKIARKLAHILCGGDLSAPTWVDEQYFLDLEREVFMSLVGEPKTLERIQHMLTTNKPLRN